LQEALVQPPQQAIQPAPPELPPEQKEFLDILNDLIASAQELSYQLATLDQSKLPRYPELAQELSELLESAKNVVVAVKRLHRFVRRRAPR